MTPLIHTLYGFGLLAVFAGATLLLVYCADTFPKTAQFVGITLGTLLLSWLIGSVLFGN